MKNGKYMKPIIVENLATLNQLYVKYILQCSLKKRKLGNIIINLALKRISHSKKFYLLQRCLLFIYGYYLIVKF